MTIYTDIEGLMKVYGMEVTDASPNQIHGYMKRINIRHKELKESYEGDDHLNVIDSIFDIVFSGISFLVSMGISPEACERMAEAKLVYEQREFYRDQGNSDMTRKENVTQYLMRVQEIWDEAAKEIDDGDVSGHEQAEGPVSSAPGSGNSGGSQ
jgi:hypothetical protein